VIYTFVLYYTPFHSTKVQIMPVILHSSDRTDKGDVKQDYRKEISDTHYRQIKIKCNI